MIVNTPEPMMRMRVVTAKDLSAKTLKALQKAGVLHPEESSALDTIDRTSLERERAEIVSILGDIEGVLTRVPAAEVVRIKEDMEVFLTRPVSGLQEETRQVCAKLTAMNQQAGRLEQERETWGELRRIASGLAGPSGRTTRDLDFTGDWLFAKTAVFPREGFEAVADQIRDMTLSLELMEEEEEIAAYLIGQTRRKRQVEDWIARHGRVVAIPGEDDMPLAEFVAKADREVARLDRELESLKSEIAARTRENLEHLVLLREGLLAESERLALLEMACASDHVTLIEGWVPEGSVEEAGGKLKEEVGCVHIETSKAAPTDIPPSKFRNPGPLRPFEVVINLFSTPGYREWDPTPVVAYFFALFFGVMLGDAVYGVLLMLLARFLLPKLTDDPEAEGFRMFRTLLYTCAGSAVVIGVLTGTYLGDFFTRFLGAPNLALSKAIQDVYLDPMIFIVVSLMIGLVHVNLGHLLMLIRGIREKKACHIIGRSALFLLQIAAIPLILRFLGIDLLPMGEAVYSALVYVMLASIVLIIAASLMEKGPFLGSILWIFDISGILGDVMSYARLAGVGLATYFLAYCFNMMSTLIANMLPEGILRTVLGSVIILFILVFGHLLNLVLSSITCFVHSLRLTFVEFLFKFYEGGGRPYSPFRLRKREQVRVRAGGHAGR